MTERDARRFRWLDQAAHGWPIERIARKEGVDPRTVRHEIDAARLARDAHNGRPIIWVPDLTLFFPINGLTRVSTCHCTRDNHTPGSLLACAVCHRSGIDDHPGLQRDPRTDPKRTPSRKRPMPRPKREKPAEPVYSITQADLTAYRRADKKCKTAAADKEARRSALMALVDAGASVEPGKLMPQISIREVQRMTPEEVGRIIGLDALDQLRAKLRPSVERSFTVVPTPTPCAD